MRKNVFFLLSLLFLMTSQGTREANAHQLFYPTLGGYVDYSNPISGFKNGEGSGFDGGAKVGLWVGVAGGIDISWAQSNFKTANSSGYNYINNAILSISVTHPAFLKYMDEKKISVIPYLSLGAGYYSPDGKNTKFGENAGLKILYLFYNADGLKGSPVALDFGAYYHRFPYQGNSISYSEIRAGITIYFNTE